MKYIIFQLYCPDKTDYAFLSWEFAKTHNFNFKDYVSVYEGETECGRYSVSLAYLFNKFNSHKPSDFKGHSLAMSDIVRLDDGFGDIHYYYCNMFGWEDITSSIVKKEENHLHERAEMVRAMDMIARSINDEDIFMPWLSNGVADGDVKKDTTDEELACYCDNETLSELMGLFLRLMSAAKKDGGLYCDRVVSKD